ncbi:hypothetical protein OJF2_57400 [Aquisphaera giovannonii]|uniref:Hydrazine synthase alpha subunit middle domain-containing protein n=1 Tax=Aquisphaera giovannonii TaxID=406548 RepID=A0A5B9W9C6_9BACT|nr:hypothetical protein [Aquisphaera giovannonii]QEH37153.1 hypothetical protein OJF2_57400 [Aquisphaera giovannonii]
MPIRRTPGTLLLASITASILFVGIYAATRRGMATPAGVPAAPAANRREAAIVFTSRTEPASLQPEAPESEPYREPVRVPWAAREGRLRVLEDGRMRELTWDRPLADGSTIIDVMSPSVSLDGTRVLFAGRTDRNDRWRIFQVRPDGSGLERLTGGPDDPGCVAVPPLRFRADGSRIPDDERRRRDFDDVDPADLGPNGFAFASSRMPDLGRDHSRRATQIWAWAPDAAAPTPLTGNRNNDRWPVLLPSNQVLFSLWSRNREAVRADLEGVEPVSMGGEHLTRPADNWMGAMVMTNGAQLAYAVKSREPVWRPRPLFNGRIAFMTAPSPGSPTRLAQADHGYIRTAPSSLAAGEDLPYEGGARLDLGPECDEEGRRLNASCPTPAPGHRVLFAASPVGASPSETGIYEVADDWTSGTAAPRRLFDDPAFVDAEPAAVYPRRLASETRKMTPPSDIHEKPRSFPLVNGEIYEGPMGYVENLAINLPIRNPIPWHDRSGAAKVDPRVNPLISPPPNVASVAAYAAGRDRFDDPVKLRVPGKWEKVAVMPMADNKALRGWIPSDPLRPMVLVGQDAEGKVARWSGKPSAGRPSRSYFAYAGDHYSGVRQDGYHYCNGCHTGHTFVVVDPTERADDSKDRGSPAR